MSWLPGFEPRLEGDDGHDGSGDCWYTPPSVLDAVSEVMPGWGDPCADRRSPAWERARWRLSIRDGQDGLADQWGMLAFVNPPYSEASAWLERCSVVARSGRGVIALVPLRIEGIAWHDHVWRQGCEVVVPRGRLRFVALDGQTYGAGTIGTAFVCWQGVDGHALASALRRNGHPCVVIERSRPLPW